MENKSKAVRKPVQNSNNYQAAASPVSRSYTEGQETYYEKNNGSCQNSGVQFCSKPRTMKNRKKSCPVKFETQPELKSERKLSRKKIQSYIPFTASKDQNRELVKKPSFLQASTSRHKEMSGTSPPRGGGKPHNSVYAKLMQPYHRLTKHNLLTVAKQIKEQEEKCWKAPAFPGNCSQTGPSACEINEMSPTLSTDSGLGECTTPPKRSNPWIDNMTRIVTGRDTRKEAGDTKVQEFIVRKQPRKHSQYVLKDTEDFIEKEPSKMTVRESERNKVNKGLTRRPTGNQENLNRRPPTDLQTVNKVLTRKPSTELNVVTEVLKTDMDMMNKAMTRRTSTDMEIVNKAKTRGPTTDLKTVNKVLTRRPSTEVEIVDSENNILIVPRRYSCLLDLVDDLCKGADTNCDRRNQRKETGRRVSLQKEKKVNLRKFFLPSQTWGCVKEYLQLSYELHEISDLNCNGCSLSPPSGEILLSFDTTFPIIGAARVGLVHSCTSQQIVLDYSMVWFSFLAM